MLRNIEKIMVDDDLILSVTTDTDFEYAYRIGDVCRFKVNGDRIMIGRLINIDDEYIEMQIKNNRIVKLAHSSIEEIDLT